jgi:hypothetical protein
MAAIKNQDDILFAAVIGKANLFTVWVLKGKIRRRLPDLDPVEIRCRLFNFILPTRLGWDRDLVED